MTSRYIVQTVSELYDKVKVKLPLYTLLRHGGSRGTAPLMLNFVTRWGWVEIFMPHLLYLRGNSPLFAWTRNRTKIPRTSSPSLVIMPTTIPCTFSMAGSGLYSINSQARTSYALKTVCLYISNIWNETVKRQHQRSGFLNIHCVLCTFHETRTPITRSHEPAREPRLLLSQ
jgi:hypothetical protein